MVSGIPAVRATDSGANCRLGRSTFRLHPDSLEPGGEGHGGNPLRGIRVLLLGTRQRLFRRHDLGQTNPKRRTGTGRPFGSRSVPDASAKQHDIRGHLLRNLSSEGTRVGERLTPPFGAQGDRAPWPAALARPACPVRPACLMDAGPHPGWEPCYILVAVLPCSNARLG